MIQKLKNKENKKYIYRVAVVAVLVLAMIGTFLPGILLVWQSKEQMNMVDAVPVEYYSPANLAVARNASANLGTYQKLQLITGRWESIAGTAEPTERKMENYEAVKLAQEQMEILYQGKVYPTSLMPNYENWYNWEAEFCKVLDATFHTYAAYYWKLTFVKYDGSEKHCVYMTEDGTILLAEVQKEGGIESNAVLKMSERGIDAGYGLEEITTGKLPKEQSIEAYLAFADIETADLRWMSLSQLHVEEKQYHLLQLHSDKRYVYSLQPMN